MQASNWAPKDPVAGGLSKSDVEAKQERGRKADRTLAASTAGRARRRV